MGALLNLLPGGTLSVVAASIVAALIAVWRTYASGKKAGRDAQKAEEAKRDAQELERIRNAADARPTVGVSVDPNNRDNK